MASAALSVWQGGARRTAESVKVHIEQLAAAAITGQSPPDETVRWLTRLDEVMADKLASAGLIPKRDTVRLGDFLDETRLRNLLVRTSLLSMSIIKALRNAFPSILIVG